MSVNIEPSIKLKTYEREISLQYWKGSRYLECPNCHKMKLKPYCTPDGIPVDPTIYGRCQREVKCGYNHYPDKKAEIRVVEVKPRTRYILPSPMVEAVVGKFDKSNLFRFFQKRGKIDFSPIFERYKVGGTDNTSQSIFFQYDGRRYLCGKVMDYLPNGHRDKTRFGTWMHKWDKTGYNPDTMDLGHCFFGQHLLTADNKDRPVAVVESEKTALFCAGVFPDTIWLATGGRSNLNAERLASLINRKVLLFPDTDSVEYWDGKVRTFGNCKIVDVRRFNKRGDKGADLADLLLEHPFETRKETYNFLKDVCVSGR